MDRFGYRLSEEEIAVRLEFLGFGPEDAARVRRYAAPLLEDADDIAEALYAHIQTLPELGAILDGHLLQCKLKQTSYLAALLRAEVDPTYAASRAWVGEIHRIMGVEPGWYLSSYCYLQELILDRLAGHPELRDDPAEAGRVARSLAKLVHFDMGLAIDGYVRGQLERLEAQRRALVELSAPAPLEVWEGVVVLPVVGRLDRAGAEAHRGAAFQAVSRGARALIVDVTRVPALDDATAGHVFDLARELEELGVEATVAGLTADLEREVRRLGVDPAGARTAPSLVEAVQDAVARGDAADEEPGEATTEPAARRTA